MTHFDDLSPYSYQPSESPMKNVGWLGAGSSFPRGSTPARARDELLRISSEAPAENLMRGVHDCEFCELESPIRLETPYNERGWTSIGMGEFHVQAKDGTIYSAPTLILHYIDEHEYLPPEGFIDALIAGADGRI